MSTLWVDEISWTNDGLLPVVTVELSTDKVLMLAWMNRDALIQTVETGYAVYWSRSRNRLWKKGEQSGHLQRVKEIRLDCDNDALVLVVEQKGGIACHTGRHSCFYRILQDEHWCDVDPVIKDPAEIYTKTKG